MRAKEWLTVRPRKIEIKGEKNVEKVGSKWIPFGRNIMIAVKQKRGMGKQGRLRVEQRFWETGHCRQTGRETPASPAGIIVLTFKWNTLTIEPAEAASRMQIKRAHQEILAGVRTFRSTH